MASTLGLPKRDRDLSQPDRGPVSPSAPANVPPAPVAPHQDEQYVRLRCLEAAARNPDARHTGGITVGVLEQASKYSAWVLSGRIGEAEKGL